MGQWISNPIFPYALFAIGMGLCLYLFCSAKVELRVLQKHGAERHERLERAMRELDLKTEAAAGSQERGSLPRTSGIDLTARSQALRMVRRGESAATIAAALGVPRNEIDLMLKVHRLMTEEAGKPVTAARAMADSGMMGVTPERDAVS